MPKDYTRSQLLDRDEGTYKNRRDRFIIRPQYHRHLVREHTVHGLSDPSRTGVQQHDDLVLIKLHVVRESFDEPVLEHGEGDALEDGAAEILEECYQGDANGYLLRSGGEHDLDGEDGHLDSDASADALEHLV
jgi:hypothetical protein